MKTYFWLFLLTIWSCKARNFGEVKPKANFSGSITEEPNAFSIEKLLNNHDDFLQEILNRQKEFGDDFPIEEFRPAAVTILKRLQQALALAERGQEVNPSSLWLWPPEMQTEDIEGKTKAYFSNRHVGIQKIDKTCMQTALNSAQQALGPKLLRYRTFWSAVPAALRAINGCRVGEKHHFTNTDLWMRLALSGPRILVPSMISNEPKALFVKIRATPFQIIGSGQHTAFVDQRIMTPAQQAEHDYLHAEAMTGSDLKSCGIKVTGPSQLLLAEIVKCFSVRKESQQEILKGLSQGSQPDLTDVLFEIVHERGAHSLHSDSLLKHWSGVLESFNYESKRLNSEELNDATEEMKALKALCKESGLSNSASSQKIEAIVRGKMMPNVSLLKLKLGLEVYCLAVRAAKVT